MDNIYLPWTMVDKMRNKLHLFAKNAFGNKVISSDQKNTIFSIAVSLCVDATRNNCFSAQTWFDFVIDFALI